MCNNTLAEQGHMRRYGAQTDSVSLSDGRNAPKAVLLPPPPWKTARDPVARGPLTRARVCPPPLLTRRAPPTESVSTYTDRSMMCFNYFCGQPFIRDFNLAP